MDELNIQNMPLYESLDKDVSAKISNAICANKPNYILENTNLNFWKIADINPISTNKILDT